MTGGPEAKDAPGHDALSGMVELERRALLDWVGEHLPQVRRTVDERQIPRWILALSFVVGLVAHVGGYLLKTSVTTEPLGLVADLLYALGWSLWTGVVVVLFVQVFPEAKRRQLKEALDAYEAAQRDQTRAASD